MWRKSEVYTRITTAPERHSDVNKQNDICLTETTSPTASRLPQALTAITTAK
jgi:hypothetical protein